MAGKLDAPAVLDYFARNREFFRPTDPERPAEFYTSAFWREQADRSAQEFYRDQCVRFFLFRNEANRGERVIGAANFTSIFRGPFHACYLGYGLDEKAQGQGYMTEGLSAAIPYLFEEMNLHRIMANYMPHNVKSGAVLKRLGFTVEGQARDYLMIAGEWRDHVMTSLINPQWRDPARPV